MSDERPPTQSEIHGGCETILRTYGIDHPTQAERRAYVGVLDRMGAFAESERACLVAGGYFDVERAPPVPPLARTGEHTPRGCTGCCACEPGEWFHVPLCDGNGNLLETPSRGRA